MNETSFFFILFVCCILMLAHQGVCIVLAGRTGWELMAETAPGFLSPKAAVGLVIAWSLLTLVVQAALWAFVIPTWVMVPVMLISEAVAIWQLRKIASKA